MQAWQFKHDRECCRARHLVCEQVSSQVNIDDASMKIRPQMLEQFR